MNLKRIGKSDLMVVPLAFGGNVFGWTLDERESFKILDEFTGNGFNLIDTANNYSYWVPGNDGGESERILGKWQKSRKKRQDIILATKVGGRGIHFPKPNATKKHILEQVDNSLQRLQTDYIDLYQLHYDDDETPVEETLSAFTELIQAGKIRYAGVSNISPERLKESMEASEKFGLTRYQSLQPHYNLMERENFETHYLPLVQSYQLSVLNYYALASGFLSGKYKTDEDLTKSPRGKDVQKYFTERGKKVIKALEVTAQKHHATLAEVALAWLLAQENITAPIASATTSIQLNELMNSIEIQLDKFDVEWLNLASQF